MKAITKEECIKLLNEKRNSEYSLVGEYQTFKKKALIKHNKCGYEWMTIPSTICAGIASCPVCAGHIKLESEITSFLKSKHLTLCDKYEGVHLKYKIKCDDCGYEWSTTLSSLLENLYKHPDREIGCVKCYNKSNVRLSPDIYKKRFEEKCKDFEMISEYITSEDKITFKCKKCNTIFSRKPSGIFIYGCPKCGSKSNSEIELYNFIKELYPSTELHNKKILYGKELDIYIPELKIAFEYDGLYWHADDKISKTYHIDKMNLANKEGIRIINIFEDEYLEHKDIVLEKIRHILNKDVSEKIYARKCIIKEISNTDKNEFLNKHHIQGADQSNIYIGGYYNNELVAVMTFSNPKFARGNNIQKDGLYELSRFASINVVGIFGRLMKYFINHYDVKEIYSFADLRWVDINNNVYIKNNFIVDSINKPTYWYCLHGKRFHRMGFRKIELKKKFPNIYEDSLTEFDIMNKTEYSRVWDCGQIKYKYIIKE